LFYAYADALLSKGDEGEALTWFTHAANADLDGETDAGERLSELDGLELIDLSEADEDGDSRDTDGPDHRTQ
jgi:hypothetical protein